MSREFKVTILGSSAAVPTAYRSPVSQVVTVYGIPYLIDCGEGTQQQLRRFKQPIGKINNIFISHLHSDHMLGILGLISTSNLLGRKNALNIYAMPELELFIMQYLDFSKDSLNFELNFIHLSCDGKRLIHRDKRVTVYSFPLKHKKPTCGFLFQECERPRNIKKEMISFYNIPLALIGKIKEGDDFCTEDGKTIPNSRLTMPAAVPRKYAYCSDTAPDKRIIPFIKGIDLLYHETTFCLSEQVLAKRTGHSTAHGAATIAKEAGVHRLITGHYSNRYNNLSVLINEAKELFPNSYLVNDGDDFVIPEKRN